MQSRRGLTATSGAELLALGFEMLAPLLGFVPSSTSQGELCLLDNHHVLEAGHLGHQSLDLGPGLHLAASRFLFRPLGSLQFPMQAPYLGLYCFQSATVGGASYPHLVGQA